MPKEIKVSPIYYMGCKRRLLNKGLVELFPKNIETFVDVFGGSGIVSMNVKADKYILNDKDINLYQLYQLFKTEEADTIIEHIKSRIEEYGLAKERTKRNLYKDKDKIEEYKKAYIKFRDAYNTNKNVLDFYTLLLYSFSQQFRFNKDGEFNMPCGNDCYTDTTGEYIKVGCEFFKKSNLELSNRDFREVLQDVIKGHTENSFIYLDPPYLGTVATYNENNGWNVKDEKELYALLDELTRLGIKWAMSNVGYHRGEENKILLDWVEKNDYKVYSFKGMNYVSLGRGNANATEILVMNWSDSNAEIQS